MNWKTIKAAPLYEINEDGQIRNKRLQKIRRNTITSKGRATVMLTLNEGTKLFYVHRLLAETFLPKPPGNPCAVTKSGRYRKPKLSDVMWSERQARQPDASYKKRRTTAKV